jgi:hypothetical protein
MGKPNPKQDEKGRFVAGNGRNGGRKPGSRNQLGEAFIADLYADWQANGVGTIVKVSEERPADYLKVIASILPKDMNLKVSPFENMTDAELNARLMKHICDFEDLKDDVPREGSTSTEH